MFVFKLLVCITGLVSGNSEVVKRDCHDTIPNCSEYTNGVCTDPLYTSWASEKCAKFCNKCAPAPTPPPVVVYTTVAASNGCADKLSNCVDYGSAVCADTKYTAWVTENCAKFCSKCSPGTHAPPSPPAATASPGVTCADKIANCAAYGRKVCDDPQYRPWVLDNCMKSCNKCDGPTAVNEACQDNVANCLDLNRLVNICSDANARAYVQENCRKTCGLCTGAAQVIDDCTDNLQNCKDYGSSVCTDTNYYQWAKLNCARTCNMCSASSGGVTTTSSAGIFGSSSGCVYKRKVHQQGEKWRDECKYNCTCLDGATGQYTCDALCLSWNLPSVCHMNPPAPGKCCPTPDCPPEITLTYPPGYVEN